MSNYDDQGPRSYRPPSQGGGWVIAACVVAAGLVIALAFVLPPLFRSRTTSPASGEAPATPSPPAWASDIKKQTNPLFDTSAGFVEDINKNNFECAYSHMGKLYRSAVTLEQFRATVLANPYLKAARSAKVGRVSTRDGGGQATGTLRTTEGNVDVVFHYMQESAGWRITGITIAGAPALAIPVKAP